MAVLLKLRKFFLSTNLILQVLETDPSYRPYCLHCDTMRRTELVTRGDRLFFVCRTVPEEHYLGDILRLVGLAPEAGCGLEVELET